MFGFFLFLCVCVLTYICSIYTYMCKFKSKRRSFMRRHLAPRKSSYHMCDTMFITNANLQHHRGPHLWKQTIISMLIKRKQIAAIYQLKHACSCCCCCCLQARAVIDKAQIYHTTNSNSARTNEQHSRMQNMVFLQHMRVQMQNPWSLKTTSCPQTQHRRSMVLLPHVLVQMQNK